ncbi:MAG TPA: RNA methyltransferase [Phycisphaerales bacterium]|nr:RNA methyltransferase [Phycisphaerales bacterium]
MCDSKTNVAVVTSIDDPQVDVYRNIRDADLRGRKHLCMVESEMVVRRLLSTDWNVHSLFLSPQKYDRLAHLIPKHYQVFIADVTVMSDITGFHIHRGVLAAVHRPTEDSIRESISSLIQKFEGKKTISLLLAQGITNVDNIGALFRNAAAFGVDGLVFDHTCCDPLYRKAIRVSMGHAFALPWAIAINWIDDLLRLREELGIQLIGCETGDIAIPMWDVTPSEKFGLIMGEEKAGLSQSTIQICDVIAEIPMTPKVPSINVAVASAVGLYEFLGRHSLDNR